MLYVGSFDVFLPSSDGEDLHIDKETSYEALCTVNWTRNLSTQKDARFLLRHMAPHGDASGPATLDDKEVAYQTPLKSPIQARLDEEFSRAIFSLMRSKMSAHQATAQLKRRPPAIRPRLFCARPRGVKARAPRLEGNLPYGSPALSDVAHRSRSMRSYFSMVLWDCAFLATR
jgi:hypothetical protein